MKQGSFTGRLLREPLLAFAVVAVCVFCFYDLTRDDVGEPDEQRINVTRADILTYMQYRANAFNASRFDQILDQLPEEDVDRIISNYIREEALYREAKSLGLDDHDYLVKRRLIQQLEFITRGMINSEVNLTDTDLETYFAENARRYSLPPEITFTQVFFSQEDPNAELKARAELDRMNAANTPFHEAGAHGDRFPYNTNYVEKDPGEVGSHFGDDFQQAVFALTPDSTRWQGPIQSQFGWHLVMVTRLEPEGMPRLEDVRSRVMQDAQQVRLDADLERALSDMVGQYKVSVGEIQRTASDTSF